MLAAMPALFMMKGVKGASAVYTSVRAAWRFPVISAPVALFDVLAAALPLLFISAAFGNIDAGNYGQVQRLVGAPLTMVSAATAQVYFKHAGDRFRASQPLMPLIRSVSLVMGGLACMVAIGMALLGHPVLHALLGPGWRTDTGFLLLVLCPVLCRIFASPISTTLIITGRLVELGGWQVGHFMVTLCVLYFAQHWLSFEATLVVFACSEFVMYAIYLLMSVRAAIGATNHPLTNRPAVV